MMTRNQFRLLLATLVAVILLQGELYRHGVSSPATIDDAREMRHSSGMDTFSLRNFMLFLVWLSSACIVGWLVGFVFIALFWREGLFIFLVANFAFRLLLWLSPHHSAPASPGLNALKLAELLLELAIVTVGLIGPARHLFQKRLSTDGTST